MKPTDKIKIDLDVGDQKVVEIARVVPGKLIYVGEEPEEAVGVKLDQVVIAKPDGSYRPYRGESFSELGIEVGKQVKVANAGVPNKPTIVIVEDPGTQRSPYLTVKRSFNDLASLITQRWRS